MSKLPGSSATDTKGNHLSINHTLYTADGSTVYIGGYLVQTSPYACQYGGPVAAIWMDDTQFGNSLSFQIVSTVNGWHGTYNLTGSISGNTAYIKDATVSSGGDMQDLSNGGGTGGSIGIDSFGAIGQPIAGTYNVNLCDSNAACLSSIKNYTEAFIINRSANYGSLASPAQVSIPISIPTAYANGIHPATGKNYYTIPTNAAGGTLTITLTPTVDVNMAVFTDAGFTAPANCDITNILNVLGSGVETCVITVTANKKICLTVSQTVAATTLETYTRNVSE